MVQKQIAFENTKQQLKSLTLSDISPRWARRLKGRRQLPVPMSITWLRWWFEIINPPKCIVGEAYSFSRCYTDSCKECGNIGDKFTLYFTFYMSSRLEENKQRFVNHWNKAHAQFHSS